MNPIGEPISLKVMDQILNRWYLDSEFRDQMDQDPILALATYDLIDVEYQKISRLSRKVRRKAKTKENVPTIMSPESVTSAFEHYVWPSGAGHKFNLN